MTNEIEIRFADPSEVDGIVELCQLHAAFEKATYDPAGKKEKLSQSLFGRLPDLFCLVAVQGETLVGYATYMKQYSTWDAAHYLYMDCLFLRSESRSMGIGETLIDRIKFEGKKLGCDLIQWQTPDFNTRAMKFYDRIGAESKSKERYFLNL